MSVGNWRDHLLIKCAVCSKLMGHHKPSTTAVCVDCEMVANYDNQTLLSFDTLDDAVNGLLLSGHKKAARQLEVI